MRSETGDEAQGKGWGRFEDKGPPLWNHPPPQIFTCGNFFKNKTDGDSKDYGKTTKTSRLSR
ncbi:hypothetical protein DVP89_06400 [Yersinia enterocolitica]|nr:hypothetical protein [Yersinia enterocolitica]EKN6056697.1 hypothetical protein [Yersinia enterocolitica]EKN6226991.1 hypothetical protein [Yersinia enterocolitica]EKN6353336.1 hypothetical protein [Yersinia enterocolitica]EKN6387877.1 hypothetical protein [Yersinia enterocolitica]